MKKHEQHIPPQTRIVYIAWVDDQIPFGKFVPCRKVFDDE